MKLQEIRDLARKCSPRSAPERRILLAVNNLLRLVDAARPHIDTVAAGKSKLKQAAQDWLDANPPGRAVDPKVRAVEDDIQWAKDMTGEYHKKEKHAGNWMSCPDKMCIKGRKMVEVGETKKMRLEKELF